MLTNNDCFNWLVAINENSLGFLRPSLKIKMRVLIFRRSAGHTL